MSITKSYNKYTDTYYAYETTYIWSEEQQKRIQKRVCIGQYDKEGKIIPNAKRGRPSANAPSGIKETDSKDLSHRLEDLDEICQAVTEIVSEIHQIEKYLNSLTVKSRELESRAIALQTRLIRKE